MFRELLAEHGGRAFCADGGNKAVSVHAGSFYRSEEISGGCKAAVNDDTAY